MMYDGSRESWNLRDEPFCLGAKKALPSSRWTVMQDLFTGEASR